MGDMNAKIGSDNVGYEDVMGKNGYGVINENGELFRDYCQTNNIVICSSIFQHKDIHNYTRTSPDGNIKNQIDHITIHKRFRGSMEDVRSYRGADVGSDHELLISRVKLKLCRQRVNQGQKKRYDTDKLKIPKVAQEFKLELRNRFQVLGETEGIEEQWIYIKQAICEVGEQTLGFKDRKQPEWITTNSIHKIQERKQIKQKINATRSQRQKEKLEKDYKDKKKEVKFSTRDDKRKYIDNIAKSAEEAANRGEQNKLYMLSKKISNSSI
ncbi:craniofacial development protein 2-like [Mytilus edulis]|uniref:craniofacial development protein 2-like n=1 Tax=Mytilus edulis TaxID=6550 RepID=UPI0039EEAF80